MTEPSEDVEWLVRSDHRMKALKALIEAPRSRSDLRELTDASRVTVKRMIEELEERNWIQENGGRYEATVVGEMVHDDLARLNKTAETAREIGSLAEALPVEKLDFDLHAFCEATITKQQTNDRLAPFRRSDRLMAEAENRLQFLVGSINAAHADTPIERESPPPTGEAVFTSDAIDAISEDPRLHEHMISVLEMGYEMYEFDGSIPVSFEIIDDILGLKLYDIEGHPPVFIELKTAEALNWAERTYHKYKEEAQPVQVDEWRRRRKA